MIHDKPGGAAQAFRAEPGPFPVSRHDEQVRVRGGSHHGPFHIILNFPPFALAPESARRRLDQVGGRSRSQRLESLAWIVPAAAQQPPVGAVRGISRRG
jgi:hypothetical protein